MLEEAPPLDSPSTPNTPQSQADSSRSAPFCAPQTTDDFTVTGGRGANAIVSSMVDSVSNIDLREFGAKLDTFKKWSVSTFKNTRQQMFEQLGKAERTSDPEFESQVEVLRDFHRRYGTVVACARHFSAVFSQLIEAEKGLAEALYQLGIKETAVKAQCDTSGESLRSLANAATSLDSCLRYFFSSVETLHSRTIVDTLDTVSQCDQARLEFDVARNDLSVMQSSPTSTTLSIEKAREQAQTCSDHYERLKQDCRVKFRLLEGNRIEVLSAQLCKLQSALSAYFAGNVGQLDAAVRELESVRPTAHATAASFLAQ